ncbi:neutral/alkaline non-lysosomal ceramidase N-terminal domain-containing protein [Actinopolymorpha alba]|uniref:neutral/alkaline non-lysosomal ceramidase N-terminal domain-containing protein n=1 Tax=Actinopolymorpha alba TaxID=533267 RepID=UPI000374BFF8|nr:neutral/alkaline non-lysosomal ceramidase N-terminal domain-containing protein [Actinopolymorpha alba]
MTDSAPVGAAVVDITPPAGLAMSGFAARTSPATGTHDRLSARALRVGDAIVVTADTCGLHEDSCERIRRAVLASEPQVDGVVVAATHTHGGPAVVPGRLGGPVDPAYLRSLEQACVHAARQAYAHARPATVSFGIGRDPGVARNRRRPDGPTDPRLPVLTFRDETGRTIAIVTSYACHPVVLGADNTLWTADYPGVVRRELERTHPDAVAIFLTGCCGDANTGHSASASMTLGASTNRTFPACERIGTAIAQAALETRPVPTTGPTGVRQRQVALALADGTPWVGRVSVLDWVGVRLVALPGEPFAATALAIRSALPGPTVVIGYADGCPGYFPTREEYAFGGYEVEDAHRYYGMSSAFAPGSAERLRDAAIDLARS